MTTIKSYSDLEQSKKLAEILPIESADMYYDYIVNRVTGELFIPDNGSTIKVGKGLNCTIAAWSLSALLGVLLEGYSFELTKSFDGKDYYCNLDGKPIKTIADNPIDACVAMIEKLHELKML